VAYGDLFPILIVEDLRRSLRFYCGLLGGIEVDRFPPEGEAAYATVQIGSSRVGLAADPGASAAFGAHRIELCVYTEDCDRAVAQLRERGVPVLDQPADQPWGERMARVADPDGNRILVLTRL
jgi:lactoylglutathione lyase